jgi:protein gp37
MAKTKIEWADVVWNPVTGCTKVSEGCEHCYAEAIAKRFWKGRSFSDIQIHNERMFEPLHWTKPKRVFVDSMGDLFHPEVPSSFIDQIINIMENNPEHMFYVLTKRADRMEEYNYSPYLYKRRNIWFGVTIENQTRADERLPHLFNADVTQRFVSCEPLLGEIDLFPWLEESPEDTSHLGHPPYIVLDLVIIGCETGPGARECKTEWVKSLIDQCTEAKVEYFLKPSKRMTEIRKELGI